ncbi:MAG: GC-type dockerin domain-anchored protein [Planctomycetota bacterium]
MTTASKLFVTAMCGLAASAAHAQTNRNIQIRSVDFTTGVLELFNFDAQDVSLDRWRFCSHDFNEQRRYTGGNGLNGVTIEAGTSVFIHFNNDAPANDPDRLDRTDLGGSFATPLDQDAYGIQIYAPDANTNSVSFGNSTLIADHVQWNIGGQGAGSSEARTQQAVNEGLWSGIGDFVATQPDSDRLDLVDLSGDETDDPTEYAVRRPNTVVNEATEGDLSSDAASPTPLAFNFGSNVVEGTVEESNAAEGDRDFITVTIPAGQALTGIELLTWDPDNIGFIAVNDGATSFVPGNDTNANFLAGVLVDSFNVGDDLLESFVNQSVTVNALGQAELGAGTYSFVVQQTSPLVQAYALDFQVSEADGCNAADLAAPFNVLDLTDVDAFIAAFLTGGDLADVAAPFGVIDLSDVDAFISAFLAGCP